MKARYVAAGVGGALLAVTLLSVGIVARSHAPHYGFLEGKHAKFLTLQPDPVGLIGREERYYVLDEPCATVARNAEEELTAKGWRSVSRDPQIFARGPHERIEVRRADETKSERLLKGIPAGDLGHYTVVRVLDPRMPRAIKRHLARWAKQAVRMNG